MCILLNWDGRQMDVYTNKTIKVSSLESKEKTECGPYCAISDNESSSETDMLGTRQF